MKIQVNFFGVLTDVTGKKTIKMENVHQVSDLKNSVLRVYPDLERYYFRICIGTKICENNACLQDGDTVSFLPPFSGG